ncbi:hypothetical protein LZ575_16220 [Antarcticibacterium sp. 1MA-6-2]|uniref:hypothetical protein n=1 Tax=Antarcticibacterium sp. 1MA-6-2 TaxID=2908210 RepID=UPI001F48245D|nr:hypothetical protein [Antarcticibacterium sp. 1MA-6-2]UJH90371.1 hypothetical protein LZ575_16220 [Antarcticibacterium sp. 1MA-6-2]
MRLIVTFYQQSLFIGGLVFLIFTNNIFAAPFQEDHSGEKVPVVEIVSTGMNFELPNEIPSGWTTFKYKNLSPDVHFFVLEKMPAGRTIEDTRAEIILVLQLR